MQLPGVTTLGTIESEDAAGHVRQMKTVQLPPFRLGPLTISGYKVQRMRRQIIRKGEDGIIGFALFNKGIAARIDSREHQLTLTDRRDHYAYTPGETLKYQLRKHVPYIKISPFAGVEDEVLFDTGSPLPYAINANKFTQIQSQHPEVANQTEGTTYGSHAMGHFGSERSGRIILLALQRLLWGTFAFHEVHCTTVNGGSHIGAPLLDYGAVVINPFRRQLVFQPYDGMASVTVANRLHDIVIVERKGLAMVGMVMQDSKGRTAKPGRQASVPTASSRASTASLSPSSSSSATVGSAIRIMSSRSSCPTVCLPRYVPSGRYSIINKSSPFHLFTFTNIPSARPRRR